MPWSASTRDRANSHGLVSGFATDGADGSLIVGADVAADVCSVGIVVVWINRDCVGIERQETAARDESAPIYNPTKIALSRSAGTT